MGAVWRARDELLSRDVAAKEIIWPPHLSDDERETARRRAVREAQMAARLNHPNVVGIYDIVEEDDHPWIIMEFLPYRSLRDIVQEDGPLTPVEAARVGLGILAALLAAHAEGVLHRDVKPANILVGPPDRVVLTDFGIARATDSPTLTNAGMLVGSPSYMAPERARGEQAVAAGDLWALGASLYLAVEGRPPFDRNGPLPTLTAVVADEPDPPRHAGPLWPVISGLLRKDPAERMGAVEAEEMLQRVAAEVEAVAAPAPTASAQKASAQKASAQKASLRKAPALKMPSWRAQARKASVREVREDQPQDRPVVSDADTAVPAAAPISSDTVVPAAPDDTVPPAVIPQPPVIPEPPVPAASPEPAVLAAPVAIADAVTPADADADADADAVVPVVPEPGATRRRFRRARVRAALTAAAVVIVITAGTAAALLQGGGPGGHKAAPPPSTRSHPSARTSPSATPKSSASKTSASSSPSRSASASASPSASATTNPGSGYVALPAGFYRFTNSTGFSIGVPRGWQISHVGHYVYVQDPANSGIFLLIDQSDQPKADPLADWEQQQANRESTYQDYHLIRLQSVSYPQAEKAADWEFTFDRGGVGVHILNRNILANARHAYALYWSTPESDWNADYHYFQAFAATFHPAP
jgi:serine/threonine protein kinase